MLYYCGTCSSATDCTITTNGGSIQLLAVLGQLLGPNQPNVLLILDTHNLSLTSLPFQHLRQVSPTSRTETTQYVVCLTNPARHQVGQLTQHLVQLMQHRHLRLNVHQILNGEFEVVVKSREAETTLDRIFLGVE